MVVNSSFLRLHFRALDYTQIEKYPLTLLFELSEKIYQVRMYTKSLDPHAYKEEQSFEAKQQQ